MILNAKEVYSAAPATSIINGNSNSSNLLPIYGMASL